MSADITEERIAERLGFLADELRSWLKYNEKGHGKTDEELSGDIHVMLSNGYTDAPPCWPSRSVLKHWIGTLDSARSQLAALQSVPQGVEVPEFPVCSGETISRSPAITERDALMFVYGFQACRDEVFSSRLVPTPPQAAPGAVDVVLDPPKSDRDCGDCTRLAICNGELACLCGPTGKMFIRKEPPQDDAVVVPLDPLLGLLSVISQRKDTFNLGANELEDYEAIRHALRTSAQDHNGEGAR